jgi:hypothetical protein
MNVTGRRLLCWQSAQAYQATDHHIGAQDQGDVGHELPGVAQQPVLGVLERRLGGLGPQATR